MLSIVDVKCKHSYFSRKLPTRKIKKNLYHSVHIVGKNMFRLGWPTNSSYNLKFKPSESEKNWDFEKIYCKKNSLKLQSSTFET